MSKVIMVTGASSGLGKALAEELHRRGYIVYGTSRQAKPGSPYKMVPMEVKDQGSVRQAVEEIIKAHGRLDVLINNAGIGLAGPTEQLQIANIQEVLEVNVVGVLRVCQAVLPHMRAKGHGLIINISSIGAAMGLPYRGVYCASKSAIDLATEALRMEVAAYGIQACSIRAGDTRTNINANRIKDFDPDCPAYRESFERVYASIDREVETGLPAEIIAKKIARLIEKKRLKRYYVIGKPLQRVSLLVKRLLPDPLFERIMKQYAGM
jgi:NAD(P)-dependent dehydrogenase (short-subunit alcohol dehydrogenase family)